MSDHAITMAEAAQRLGVSVATVYGWAKSGRIPVTRLGRQGFLRAAFDRWMAEGVNSAPAPTTPQPHTIAIDANGVTIEFTITIRPTEPAVSTLRMVR